MRQFAAGYFELSMVSKARLLRESPRPVSLRVLRVEPGTRRRRLRLDLLTAV